MMSLIRTNLLTVRILIFACLLRAFPSQAQQGLLLYVDGAPSSDNQLIQSLTPTDYLLTSSASGPVTSYEWLKNELTVVSTSAAYLVTAPGVYRLRLNYSQLSNCVIVNSGTGTNSRNYTATDQARYANIKETENLDQSYGFDKQITYTDGFGRPMQRIAVQSTPGTESDLIQPFSYGPQGEVTKQYLPFAKDNKGQFDANWEGDQGSFYKYRSLIGHTFGNGLAYSEVVADNDPLRRKSETSSPGEDWKMGSGHTRHTNQRSNTTDDDVRLWTYSPISLASTGTLIWTTVATPANTLIAVEEQDEDNNNTIAFANEKGQTVCQRTYLSGTPSTSGGVYLETNYAYDAAGRLLAKIPPKASQQLLNGTATATTAFLEQYLFISQFDALGHRIARKGPGQGWTLTVYDRWDRLAASQDPNQGSREVWSFIKYDAMNRPVMTGEFAETRSVAALTSLLQNWPANQRGEQRANNVIGYTLTQTYPSEAEFGQIGTVDYYDDYDYFPLSTGQRPDLAFTTVYNTPQSTQTRGLRTGGQVRTLDATDYNALLTSVVYYDQYNRVIEVVQDNFTVGNSTAAAIDRTTNYYASLSSDVSENSLTHQRYNVSGNLETHTTNTTNEYNEQGNLLSIVESIDGAPYVTLAAFEYNDLGQLVDKKLGYDNNNHSFIQSLDYRYNIRGWLTNINNRNLSNNEWLDGSEPNMDTEPQDAFGLELKYADGSTTNGCYNGNISAAVWNTTTNGAMRQYGYTYDKANRLTSGMFSRLEVVNSDYSWTAEKDDQRNEGRYTTSGISYDANGNILFLNRTGLLSDVRPTKIFGRIDELSFTRDGNRLHTVSDKVRNSAASNDFEVGVTGATYEYDNNGNLTRDPNKLLTIYYNQLDLPYLFRFDNFNQISITYTTAGEKIGATYSTYTPSVGYTNKFFQYIQGFTYSSSTSEPLTVTTPTGRAIFESAATQTQPAGWAHEYHIRDHQGSLRLVLKQEPVLHYRLTMETVNASEEEVQFKRVAETRQVDVNHARTGISSARLNAHQVDRANGPATVLTVAAGDSINLEVFGLYDKGTVAPRLSKAITPIIAISGSINAKPITNPDNQARSQRNWVPSITAGVAVAWDKLRELFVEHQSPPHASFTYELYNKDSTLVISATSLLTETEQSDWQQLVHGFRAKEAGYVKVYLANASSANVWFDDMKVSVFPVPTKQENHYDPFGQNLQEIETASAFDSKQQYTGKERIGNYGLDWTDFGTRSYDNQLGQWHSADPKSQYDSPYVAMGDNHVNNIDYDGQFAWALAALSGGFINLGTNFNNVHNIGQALSYFATGAAGAVVGTAVSSGVNSVLGGGNFWAGVTQSSAAHETTGLIAGTLTGAAGGLVGGFIGGFGNAATGGASLEASLASGGSSGLNGGLSGGAIGGIYGFYDAAFRGRNLLTGSVSNYPITEQLLASTAETVNPDYGDFTVWNRDGSDVFFKPEDGVYGMHNRIRHGQAINDPVDGIATSLHRDQVFKIPGKPGYSPSATVYTGGHVMLGFNKTSAAALSLKYLTEPTYHYGWMTGNQLDPSWYPLFRRAFFLQ